MSKGSINSKTSLKFLSKFTTVTEANRLEMPMSKPLVIIDINLGKGKGKQQIVVYKEDDPK